MELSRRRWLKRLRRRRYHAKLRRAYFGYIQFSKLSFGGYLRILRDQEITIPTSNSLRFVTRHPKIQYHKLSRNRKRVSIRVPSNFCFIHNYEGSLRFIHFLLSALRSGGGRSVYIDYRECQHIGADASMYLDLILNIFIVNISEQKKVGLIPSIKELEPINFVHSQPIKVLFSIGTFRNFKGLEIPFPDI